jgi:hypothetical protein
LKTFDENYFKKRRLIITGYGRLHNQSKNKKGTVRKRQTAFALMVVFFFESTVSGLTETDECNNRTFYITAFLYPCTLLMSRFCQDRGLIKYH